MTDSFNNNVTALSVETPVTFLNACLFVLAILSSAISLSDAERGEGPGWPGPPLFFDQNEARRAEKIFWETVPPPPPPYLRVWMTAPTPLSQGLDPPLVKEKNAT